MNKRLNKAAYTELVAEDVRWLNKLHPNPSIEKAYIILVMEESVDQYYPAPSTETAEEFLKKKAIDPLGEFWCDGGNCWTLGELLADFTTALREEIKEYKKWDALEVQNQISLEAQIQQLKQEVETKDKIIAAQTEYQEFLSKEYESTYQCCIVHGIPASQETISKGERLRKVIEDLTTGTKNNQLKQETMEKGHYNTRIQEIETEVAEIDNLEALEERLRLIDSGEIKHVFSIVEINALYKRMQELNLESGN